MKHLTLFAATVMAGLAFLPVAAWAGGPVEAGLSTTGGGIQQGGGGGGGSGGWNDVDFSLGRSLNWDRDWSSALINAPGAMSSTSGWCGGRKLGQPERSDLSLADSSLAELFRNTLGENLHWETYNDGFNAWVAAGTCRSPTVVWNADQGAFEDRNDSLGGYGLRRSDGKLINANGSNGSRPNCSSPDNAKQKAWCFLSGPVVRDIGILNKCKVLPNVANWKYTNDSGCRKTLTKLFGLNSDSELIPPTPNRLKEWRTAGTPNTAIVRVWQECELKFPKTDDVKGGDELKVSTPHNYQYSTLSTKRKRDAAKALCAKPILERTIPRVTEGPGECPNGLTSRSPFRGDFPLSLDKYCKGNPLFNYFYTNPGPSQVASANESDGAFASQGSSSNDTDFSDPVAGTLFSNCKNPPAGQTKSNTDYCGSVYEGDRVGQAEKNAATNLGSASFDSQCDNGPLEQSSAWDFSDYAGQLAYLMGSGSLSGSGKGQSAAAANFNLGPPGSAQNAVGTNAFVNLFIWHNPVLANLVRDEYGKDPAAYGISARPKGWPPYQNGLDQIKFKNKQLQKLLGVKQGDSPTVKLKKGKTLACLLLSDWAALDWKVGGSTKKSVSSVTVRLNPRPNRLYVVQIVMLDSRENIVSESLQFVGSPASGRLPSLRTDPRAANCLALWGPDEGEMIGWDPPTPDTKPEECIPPPDPWLEEFVEVSPLPAATSIVTSQPRSQLTGQSWPLTADDPLGQIRLSAGTDDQTELVGNADPGPDEEIIASSGIWLPRALRATVYNREDNKSDFSQSTYQRSHRIRAQSDSSDQQTAERFKLVTNANGGYLTSENNTIPAGSGGWLQAELPLLYVPEDSESGSPFYNGWTVGVSNPTRAPAEDLDAHAKQIAGPGVNWDALDSAGKDLYRDQAEIVSRQEVDEHRLVTALGEGRGVTKSKTVQECQEENGDVSCEEKNIIASEWHRLTSDACPAGQLKPLISINNGSPETCNPDKSVGFKWKVSDAYRLPFLPQNQVTELASTFRSDGSADPAHFVLDSDPTIPLNNILNIAIWERDAFANRTGDAQPLYQLRSASTSRSISLCTPQEPVWETRYRTLARKLADLPHRNQNWNGLVLGQGGQYAVPSGTAWPQDAAYFNNEFWGGDGNPYRPKDGVWVSRADGGNVFYGPSRAQSPNGSPGAGELTRYLRDEAASDFNIDKFQYFVYTRGQWKTHKRVNSTNTAKRGVWEWIDNHYRWQRITSNLHPISGPVWGQGWWNGPQDQGDWEIWETYQEPYQVQTNPNVGQCTYEPAYQPNAQEVTDPRVVPHQLPAGNYVISFSIIGELPSIDRWGIKGKWAERQGTEWVNGFDLQQQENLTSIYRYRPTG